MKKKTRSIPDKLCTVLLCTALSCAVCACGAGTDTPDASETDISQDNTTKTDTSGQTPDTAQDPAPDQSTGQNAENATDENNAAGADTETGTQDSDPETDTTVSVFPSHIQIKMQREEEDLTADDGTILCTTSYAYPVVSIEGNDDAAGKINADIHSRIDSFTANTEVKEWAKEGYEYNLEDGSEYPFLSYYDDMTFGVQRADSNVISFAITFYSFTGGAHGNYTTQGVNYNAKTGEQIAFADLSDDADAFHEDTLAFNQALAKTEAYQMRMFSEDMLAGVSLETVLYAEGAWYLSTSGLTFISDPYALGPYAAGTIEFIIPYTDLAGMGFNESYTYADRTAMKLLTGTANSFDLNGDGEKETILFGTETVAEEDDTYTTLLHLSIDDVDFTDQCNDVFQEVSTGYPMDQISLFDLNVDDGFTELVLLSGESEDDNFVYSSYFFRYTKDGRLLYLGMAKGDALDPLVTITELTREDTKGQ